MIRILYLIAIPYVLFLSPLSAQTYQSSYDSLTIETILSLPEEKIDLGIACLVLAKDAYPNLNISSFDMTIDYMANRLDQLMQGNTDPLVRIAMMNSLLYRPGWWNDSLTFTYDLIDPFGDRVRQTAAGETADEVITNFTFDPLGNMTSYYVDDDDDLVTDLTYNTLSQLTQKDQPDAGVTQYVYDKAGNLRLSQTARQAQANPVEMTQTLYDDLNRVTEVGIVTGQSFPSAWTAPYTATWKERYDYDQTFLSGSYPKGKLTRVQINMDDDTNPDYERRMRYDSFGNVEHEELLFYDDSQTITNTLSYAYDNLNKLTQLTYVSAAGNFGLNYEYDEAGRLARVLGGLGEVDTIKTFAYAPTGLVTASRLAEGMETLTYLYQIRDWLESFNTGSGVFSQTLGYENNGNINSMSWTSDGFSGGYGFGYDHINRLISADAAGQGIDQLGNVGYRYDTRGNIQALNRNTPDPNTTTDTHFYYANSNRLKSAFGLQSDTHYFYDHSGNVTKDVNRGLDDIAYNYLNLPTRMTKTGGTVIDYGYNGTNRIYKKRGSTERYYVRTATGQIIAELNPNATGGGQVLNFEISTTGTAQLQIEHDGQTETFSQSGSTEVSATALHDGIRLKPSTNSGEVHLTDLFIESNEPVPYINLLADGVVGQKRFANGADTDYYYLKDHLGSTRVILRDNNGTAKVTATNDFYPFGKMLRTTGSDGEINKFKFIGKERDGESGLDYFGARYYDAEIGLFRSLDRFSLAYPSVSPYQYAYNSPLAFVDINGDYIWISYKDESGDSQNLLYEVGMTYEGGNEFVQNAISTLNRISDVKIGEEVLSSLSSSKNDIFVNSESPKKPSEKGHTGGFSFTRDKNGGGTIQAGDLLKDISAGNKIEPLAHELFHAFQNHKKQGGPSVNSEVEASLFGDAIIEFIADPDIMNILPFGGTNAEASASFQTAYVSLLYGDSFNKDAFVSAISNFKTGSSLNSKGLYNSFPILPVKNKPLISQFYPLIP